MNKNKFRLTEEQINHYKKYAYIKLKNVLSPDTITYYNSVISKKVDELNEGDIPLEQKDTYGKAFIQLSNLWQEDKLIKEFVFNSRIANISAELMQVDGVRLYHDQALFKEAGGGITPWHAGQFYWPLSSDKTITAWIPLQEIPLNMGPIEFSAGSNKIVEGRNLSISDESEKTIKKNLRINSFEHIIEPFDIGEVSFHSGWVFHRAGKNTSKNIRKVMTIIYMDKDMILKEPDSTQQQYDKDTWCPGVKVGEVINSPLNPILS
ncbi:MAG: phytanoyl-CoA dioxygenase family protein [Saprospiraceae bacterium]